MAEQNCEKDKRYFFALRNLDIAGQCWAQGEGQAWV